MLPPANPLQNTKRACSKILDTYENKKRRVLRNLQTEVHNAMDHAWQTLNLIEESKTLGCLNTIHSQDLKEKTKLKLKAATPKEEDPEVIAKTVCMDAYEAVDTWNSANADSDTAEEQVQST